MPYKRRKVWGWRSGGAAWTVASALTLFAVGDVSVRAAAGAEPCGVDRL